MFGFKKTIEKQAEPVAAAPPIGVVVSSGSTHSHSIRGIFSGRGRVVLIVVALIAVGAAALNIHTQFQTFKVGTHSFSRKDLNAATDAQKKALVAAKNTGKDAPNAKADAQKQAILLAGLETEADNRHIPYGTAVIDEYLKSTYDKYQGKNGYMAYMAESYGWGQADVYRFQTVQYLQNKLQSMLISTRTYSFTFVRWDNIKAYYPNEYKTLYNQKQELLTSKYLPLYEQGASTDQLAASAEVNDSMTADQQKAAFDATRGIPVFYNKQTFGVGHSLDDFEKYSEGEDTGTKLASLTKPGTFTGPFKGNDGMLVIARLESTVGGKYASWNDFIRYYQDQSGVSFKPSTTVQMVGVLTRSLKSFGVAFKPQTAYAAADCLSSHRLSYQIVWRDQNTNAPIGGNIANSTVSTSTTRTTTNCNKQNYIDNGYAVGSGSSYSVSKSFTDNGAGSMSVILDCNGPSWTISNTNTGVVISITGYTYQSTSFASGQSNAYPFFAGSNGSPTFQTNVYYTKNAPPAPTGSITCASNTANITLTISWQNANNASAPGVHLVRTDNTGAVIYTGTTVNQGSTPVTDTRSPAQGTAYTYKLLARWDSNIVLDTVSGCKLKPPTGTNSVTCSPTSSSSIHIDFTWTGVNSGSQANLRPDSSTASPLASGPAGQASGSGAADHTGLAANSTHTYYLTGNGTVLAQSTCTTPPTACTGCSCSGSCAIPGTGTITCGTVGQSTIDLNYTYQNASSGVNFFRGISPNAYTSTAGSLSASTGTGTLNYTGLSPGTTYRFAMQDIATGNEMSTVDCTTTNPVAFSSGGSANPGVDDDETPTTATPYGTPTGNPNSPTATGLQCSIDVTKIPYGGSPSLLGTYGPVACTAGTQITGTPIAISGNAGDQFCATLKVTPQTGTLNSDGTISSPSGTYTQPSPTCTPIVARPLYKVFNSSITTGGDVGTCSATTGALGGWYNNATANDGSGAQLATYALAQIIGVGSNHTDTTRAAKDLSFANSVGVVGTDKKSPSLGGLLAGQNCITALAKQASVSSDTGNSPTNINTLLNPASGPSYYHTGDLTISNSAGKKVDKALSVVITGNVYISEDIIYDQSGWAVDNVPSFVVVATGNIYISGSVTHLDGTYEAGGSIYTCGTAYAPVAAPNLWSSCNKQLTVVGSFVAKKINFLRTYGTLHNEGGGGCANAGSSSTTRATCAAEVFEFSPEHYLEKPTVLPGGAGATQYDAITSLPPVL